MPKINSKKTVVNGITFDSKTEAEYYQHLLQHPDVKDIIIQPKYELIPAFECVGYKDKPITRKRQPMTYTADFKVDYGDHTEVIDVKGGWKSEKFVIKKKLWEYQHKRQLVIVQKKKGEWVKS